MIKLTDGTIIATQQYKILHPCTDKIPLSYEKNVDYDKYVTYSLHQTYHDNLFFYHIPQSFKVYSQSGSLTDKNISFSISFNFTNKPIYEYQFKRPIDVIGLDIKSNIDVLLATAIEDKREDVIKVLTQQTGHYSSITDFLFSMNLKGFLVNHEKFMIYIYNPDKYLTKTQN